MWSHEGVLLTGLFHMACPACLFIAARRVALPQWAGSPSEPLQEGNLSWVQQLLQPWASDPNLTRRKLSLELCHDSHERGKKRSACCGVVAYFWQPKETKSLRIKLTQQKAEQRQRLLRLYWINKLEAYFPAFIISWANKFPSRGLNCSCQKSSLVFT